MDSPDYLGSWWTQAELPEAYRPVLDTPHPVRIDELFFDAHPIATGGHRRLPCPGRCGVSFTITALAPTSLHYHNRVGPHRTHLEPIPTYDAKPHLR